MRGGRGSRGRSGCGRGGTGWTTCTSGGSTGWVLVFALVRGALRQGGGERRGVNGPGNAVRRTGFMLRYHVSGRVYSYALGMAVGAVAVARPLVGAGEPMRCRLPRRVEEGLLAPADTRGPWGTPSPWPSPGGRGEWPRPVGEGSLALSREERGVPRPVGEGTLARCHGTWARGGEGMGG